MLTAVVAGIITGIAPTLGSRKAFYTAIATFLVQALFVLAGTILLPGLDMVSSVWIFDSKFEGCQGMTSVHRCCVGHNRTRQTCSAADWGRGILNRIS